jgi:hypothetical protein
MTAPPTLPDARIVSMADGPSTFLLDTAWMWPVLGVVLGLAWFAFRLLVKRGASPKWHYLIIRVRRLL